MTNLNNKRVLYYIFVAIFLILITFYPSIIDNPGQLILSLTIIFILYMGTMKLLDTKIGDRPLYAEGMIVRGKAFIPIVILTFLISYFVAPTPSPLSIILSPGLFLANRWLGQLDLNCADCFTNVHHFFALASFLNIIIYTLIFTIIYKIVKSSKNK